MNVKKLVSVSLVIVILFVTLCPISLAAYVYGPDKSSYTVDLDSNDVYREIGFAENLEKIEIQVTQSGIYSVSNLMGGNVSSKFVICGEYNNSSLNPSIAPLPIATYGSNGENDMTLSAYNNASARKASVYLEAGQTYYVCMVGENDYNLHNKAVSESKYLTVNLDYIEPQENQVPYETNVSSMNYTAPNAQNMGWYTDTSRGAKNIYTDRVCNNDNLESISGDSITEALNAAATTTGEDENAPWYEEIITFLLCLIGDGLRAVISWALGADITIDKILFNDYDNIRLSIFDSSRVSGNKNNYLENSGMLDTEDGEGVITKYFMLFRNIAICVYIVILLYMGVSILLSSTGNKKAKYKDRIIDWVKGIIILVFFPYVMKYTIVLNDAIVEYVGEIRTENNLNMPTVSGISSARAQALNIANSDNPANGDIMETMRLKAKNTGKMVYAVMYLLLLKELVGFIYIYFKRLISVVFLIIIFPLVTISYAVDKIGDGKSQAFSHWFSEFVLNVFMQSFQAVNYVVIMSIIFALSLTSNSINIILVLVGFEYISKGDELLRSMFSKMSGGGANTVPKSLNDAVKTVAAVEVVKQTVKQIGHAGNRVRNFNAKVTDLRKSYYSYYDKKIENKNYEREHANDFYANSIMNPEKHALDDVEGNMRKLLVEDGSYTPEEQKEFLDRLLIAETDPTRGEIFQVAYTALSDSSIDGSTPSDKTRIRNLIIANRAINETISGKSVNGILTEMERNFNAKIIMDVIRGGSAGMYGSIYNYLDSKKMLKADNTPWLDKNGANVTALTYLKDESNKRRLNKRQQEQFSSVQDFFGAVAGLDTSEFGIERAVPKGHNAYSRLAVAGNEVNEATRIQATYGTTGGNTELQARAAKLVARMKTYKEKIDSGAIEALSATEGMELAKEWDTLSKENDVGVRNILNQLGDSKISGNALEADVGFNMQQFKTMAAITVMNDKEHLEGTEEEQKELIQEAGKTLVEVANNVEITEEANGNLKVETETIINSDGTTTVKDKTYDVDKVAKQMLERAELDDFINGLGKEYLKAAKNHEYADRVDFSQYIRTNETQEEIRDNKELEKRRNDYRRHQQEIAKSRSVAQAKMELMRSGTNLVGATASMVLTPANIGSAVATASLAEGLTGDAKPTTILGTATFGSGLGNAVESIIPGTEASSRSSSKGLGAKANKVINERINRPAMTEQQIDKELNDWAIRNNNAKEVNTSYKNRFVK